MGFECSLIKVSKYKITPELSTSQIITILENESDQNTIDWYCSDGYELLRIIDSCKMSLQGDVDIYKLDREDIDRIIIKIAKYISEIKLSKGNVENALFKLNQNENEYREEFKIVPCDGVEFTLLDDNITRVWQQDEVEECDKLVLTEADKLILYSNYLKTMFKMDNVNLSEYDIYFWA